MSKPTLVTHDMLGEALLKKNDDQTISTIKTSELQGKYIGLYFSAHWCPPCRQFTPHLRDFYNRFKAQGKPFEIVFVSADSSKAEFEGYFKDSMPWLAVPFEKDGLRSGLSKRLGVMGIPALAIIAPDGTVVNRNARGALSRDLDGQQFPWAGQEERSTGGMLMPILVMVVLYLIYTFFFKEK